MPKLGFLLGVALSTLALASGTRVTLYPAFAEIAEPVRIEHGVFVWQPGERVAAQRVEDLVWMTGVEVQRRVWRKGTLWIFARGEQGVLHHLTRGLSGSVRYALEVEEGRLSAWLRVRNALDAPIEVEELRFISGSVPLAEGGRPLQVKAVARSAPAEEGVFVGGRGGVFRYRLSGPLLLEPEVTELPLFALSVRPAFYWRYRGPFQKGERLFFRRGYRLEAPRPLAAGRLDLFSGGDFLGRVRVPDTYAGEQVELELGPATRAQSKRRVKVLRETPELARYRVTTTVENRGADAVEVEIVETFHADAVELELSEGERLPGGYRVAFSLAPGEAHTYRFQVTLHRKPRR